MEWEAKRSCPCRCVHRANVVIKQGKYLDSNGTTALKVLMDSSQLMNMEDVEGVNLVA